jgi:two-component system, NtrC family, response regulator AtoC
MRVLVVDDDTKSGQAVSRFLSSAFDCDTTVCETAVNALELFSQQPFPMVISDIRMPGMEGLELLQRLRDLPKGKQARVVLMTGYANLDSAVQAMRLGAFDYLKKPVDAVVLSDVYTRLQRSIEMERETSPSESESTHSSEKDAGEAFAGGIREIANYGAIGIYSEAMRAAVDLAMKYHESAKAPVLIEGPTGTGKESVARLIHHGEGQNNSPFIPVNCSAISPGLFESELFGYEPGAFTGASSSGLVGKLEQAEQGTLFLDEISDLPLELQPKLLRVLQEREIVRVGGTRSIPINIRIITATNQNLNDMVKAGSFRSDLYHRLSLGQIQLPPLADRPEDIVPLAHYFLTQFATEKRKKFQSIDPEARKILRKAPWHGNVRELKNVIERVVILHDDALLRSQHLNLIADGSEQYPEGAAGGVLCLGSVILPEDSLSLSQLEDEILQKALKKFNGNQSKTAQYLGLARNTLRSRLKQLGLA